MENPIVKINKELLTAKNKQQNKNYSTKEFNLKMELFPRDINKLKQEINLTKKEIINIKNKLSIVNEQLNKKNNEIIIQEKILTKLFNKKNSIKIRKKQIINSLKKDVTINLKKELFSSFIGEENIKLNQLLLLFFNFQKDYEGKFIFIIKNK